MVSGTNRAGLCQIRDVLLLDEHVGQRLVGHLLEPRRVLYGGWDILSRKAPYGADSRFLICGTSIITRSFVLKIAPKKLPLQAVSWSSVS